jgi:hypothetical protein
MHDEYPAGILTGLTDDLWLMISAQVPGREQDNPSVPAIDHGGGIATGISPVVPYNDHGRPGLSAIFRTTHDEIDVICISTVVLSSLREGEQAPFRCFDHRRDAKALVAMIAGLEKIVEITGLCMGWLYTEPQEHDQKKTHDGWFYVTVPKMQPWMCRIDRYHSLPDESPLKLRNCVHAQTSFPSIYPDVCA